MPASPETILLEPDAERRVRRERPRGSTAVRPGMLIDVATDGTAGPRAAGSLQSPRAYADLNTARAGTVGDEYASDEPVRILYALPGDMVYAWVDGGENVADRQILQQAAGGLLENRSGTGIGIAVAAEAVDNSAETDPARIRVEVM